MAIQEFRALYDAKPFRPFNIHLADGRKVYVRHREFAMLSPSGRTVHVYQPDDSCDIIDLLLVTSLSVRQRSAVSQKQS